jgi:hypothetical protein
MHRSITRSCPETSWLEMRRVPARGTLLLLVVTLSVAACRSSTADLIPTDDPSFDVTPGGRSAHDLVYHAGLRQVVLLGGAPHGDIWGWDGARWSHLGAADGPGPRSHFGIAYHDALDLVLLHGGLALGADGPTRHGDLWSWNGRAWSPVLGAGDGPGARDHHAMVYDSARGVVVLFGGNRGTPGKEVELDDTWLYDGTRWTLDAGARPPARSTHRLVYDSRRQRVVLFGGWSAAGLLGDTWEWDGVAWRLASTAGPSARFASRMAYDARRRQTVLFGGRGAEGDLADTWTWDGTAWTQHAPTGPSARNVHAMAYDPRRERVVLYGGLHAGDRLADTWTWDGARWQRAPDDARTPGTPAR